MDKIVKGIGLLSEYDTHTVYSKVLIGLVLFLFLLQIASYVGVEMYYKKPLRQYYRENKYMLSNPKDKKQKFRRIVGALIDELEYITLPMFALMFMIIITFSLSIESLGFFCLLFLSLFVDIVGVVCDNPALKFIGRIGTCIAILLGAFLGISNYRVAFSDLSKS